MRKSVIAIAISTALMGSSHGEELHPQAYQLSELRGDISPEEAERALEAMFRHIGYVLHHEIGHLLINELDLPVLGWEEDAADSLATLMLLWGGTQDAYQTLYASTHAWVINHERRGLPPSEMLADEHSLDLQRAYHSVCMMLGADAQAFTPIADLLSMPEQRRVRCARELDRLDRSWKAVLEPHRRTQETSTVHSVYLEPGPDTQPFAEVLRAEGLIDNATARLAEAFVIPREVGIVGRDCGHANAYYVGEDARIDICYELAGMSFHMFADAIVAERSAADEPRLPAEGAN
jgi:hypothetical protein